MVDPGPRTHRGERLHPRTAAAIAFAEGDRGRPAQVLDAAVGGLGRADEAQPAEHAIATEAGVQGFVVQQAIEDRHHRGGRAHRRGHRLDRAVQVVGLARQHHQVERRGRRQCGQVFGDDMRDREPGITQRTVDRQPVALELRGPRRPHQEGDLGAGLGQAPAEIAAGAAGPQHQHAQDRAQLRSPTPRRNSHSDSADSTATKPSISA